MFFSGITENLNWVILITNFLTFKRWDGHGGSLKGPIFRGGGRGHEKSINKGNCPKRGGGLDSADLRGGGFARKRRVDTPMHTMVLLVSYSIF